MELSTLIRMLRARRLLMLGVTAGIGVLTLVWAMLLPQRYTATTELVIDAVAQDPVSGAPVSPHLAPRYIATQVDIIQSSAVAAKAADRLLRDYGDELTAHYPALKRVRGDRRLWLSQRLRRDLSVVPARESGVVAVSFSAADPQFAATVANAFADTFVETNLQLRTGPAEQFARWYDEQLGELRRNLEEAQRRLSDYQQQKQIVALDERLDIETARLAELSSLLVASQRLRLDSQAREEQLDGGGGMLVEIMSDQLVQSLRVDLARAQARLDELSTSVGVNHPQYRQASREVASLQDKLDAAVRNIGASLRSDTRISEARESDLGEALAAQRRKVLELNRQRNQLALLNYEVENAQASYSNAMQRASQTKLESQRVRTEVAILSPAAAPLLAASPDRTLILMLGVFLGALVGLGVALFREMTDRRVRGAADIEAELGLPVLARLPRPARNFEGSTGGQVS